MGDFEKVVVAVLGGTFTLAMLSVILSRNSNTVAVVQTSGSALSSVIQAAESPVSGSSGGGSSFGSSFGSSVNSLFNAGSSLNSTLNSISNFSF